MGTKSNFLNIATSLIPIRKIKKIGFPNIPKCYVIVSHSLLVIVSVPILSNKMSSNSIADMIKEIYTL